VGSPKLAIRVTRRLASGSLRYTIPERVLIGGAFAPRPVLAALIDRLEKYLGVHSMACLFLRFRVAQTGIIRRGVRGGLYYRYMSVLTTAKIIYYLSSRRSNASEFIRSLVREKIELGNFYSAR